MPSQVVGRKVGDPDEQGAAVSPREDLRGRVVVRVRAVDHRPHEPPRFVVEVDEQLAHDRPIEERHDPVVAVEAGIDTNPGTRRWCTAPQSRSAAQTSSGLASITISFRTLAILAFPPRGRSQRLAQPRPAVDDTDFPFARSWIFVLDFACENPRVLRTDIGSPHHLSRIFHSVTGTTISRHRRRLRARRALERLAAGDRDLARLAFELGFADQSHLCRVLRVETGQMPSALRRALAQPAPEGGSSMSSHRISEPVG